MVTKQTIRTSIELLPGQAEAIQYIAFELGYIQTRGVGNGKVGSMAQLMQAIAKGEIQLTKNQSRKEPYDE